MPQAEPPSDVLRFGAYALDPDLMRLTRDGAPVALGPLPLRILITVMQANGRVVSREHLKAALWPHTARIDTGRRLNTAVRALREALGDAAEAPTYIETVRGRGYRWIGGGARPAATVVERSFVAAASRIAATAAMLVCVLALGSGQNAPAPWPTASLRERFVEITAQASISPEAALASLEGLVAASPSYGAAQVLRAQLLLNRWRATPNAETLAAARAGIAQARDAVGPTPDVLALSADLMLEADWDWRGAERAYRRALAQASDHARARKGLAWLLINADRADEALGVLEPVLASAARGDSDRAEFGWIFLRMRRPDLALEMCAAPAAAHINLLSCRHTALARVGRVDEAREAGLSLMRLLGAEQVEIAAVRQSAPSLGYARFLDWRSRAFLPASASWFHRAQVYADAGDGARALASLERAVAAREPQLFKLATTEEFAMLRTSDKFIALLDQVMARI